jgi:hypothetical protein
MTKNIFVPGLDEFNLRRLQSLPDAADYTFHQLLSHEELQPSDKDPRLVEHVLNSALEQLAAFDRPIDAIVGYWDYPISTMLPFLCEKYGVPSASLRSVLMCEHKYWSRVVQQEIIPACVPQFQRVDPFDDDALATITLDFPFWIKPVKAHSSQLSFKIHTAEEFHTAIQKIREGIGHFAQIFNVLLQHTDLDMPADLISVKGQFCIIEEPMQGRQCTIEGFVFDGVPHTYGLIDTVLNDGLPTFARYQYPSTLPASVQECIEGAARKVMTHIGYNHALFNIEFFYDAAQDKIWLLEINTRTSQSHCNLFEKVDGMSNLGIMVAVGLGKRPLLKHREGEYGCAAKCFLRRFDGDALVTAVPTAEELDRIEQQFPGTLVKINAKAGKRLSDMPNQDPYSYQLGEIFLGARDEAELLEKLHTCEEILTFRFEA